MESAYGVQVQVKALGPTDAPKVHWVVVDLRIGSAGVELEARPEDGRAKHFSSTKSLKPTCTQWSLNGGGAPPPYFDEDSLQELQHLAIELGRYGTGEFVVT